MKKLSGLRKSGALRKLTTLRPVMRNDLRWSSTFNMVSRYYELKPFLNQNDPELAVHIPSASEELNLKNIFEELKKFESVWQAVQTS